MKMEKEPVCHLSTNEAQQELQLSRRGCLYRKVIGKLGCGRAGCVFSSEVPAYQWTPASGEDSRVALRFVKRQHRNRETHHLMSELYTHWVLSGHPTMSTLRTVLLTDNYIVIVTDFVSGTSLSSFWTRTLHAPVEKEHEQEAASPTEAVTTVAHNFEAHTYTCASVQHCTGDEEASDSLPLPHSPKSWKRMSEPVSRRATHAGVPVVAACTDSEDEDLYFLTSQHTNGIHMHAPHACSSAAQDQPSQSAFTAKRRTDPVAGATPLQGEHRWLREKMYGDYGEVAQNDLEASDDDEPVEESVESTITHVTAAPLLHVQRPHAKRFSESAVQSPSMNATHASQHKLRQSSSGVLPTRSSSRQLAHKRCSQPVTVHTHSKVEHVYADHSRSTSPLPLPDVVPEQPECSRPPSEAQNIPQKHAQAPMCSKPGPSHMQKSSPFSEGTFSSPPVGQGSCKACLSVTGMHDMHNPAPLERVPTPEATQLHTCMASPSATVHGMHGRMHAPPIARLFSDQSDEFWGTDDSDDEDTYTNNPASRCSFESSTASGVLGTSPYNTLRPPARLRASSINVPTNATNIFNSPVKNSSRTKRASQNIPKGKRRQQARAARAAQGMTPRNTSLKILEGSPSMATPVPNVLGGTSPGATENLQQLAQRTHSQAAQSCAASLVTSSSSSSSDGSELSASASSSSKEACMLFMHASQKYSAQFSKKDDAHSINMRRVATSQHAQPSSRPVHGCRVADASQNRTERPSRSQYVAEECKKKPHEQAGFVQRMHVVRKIFQQLLSLLEASHKHDVFLGALHPQNVMVTWEEGESKNDPPSVRVYVTSAGYLRELHELDDAAAAGAPGYLQRFMPPEQLQGMPRSPDGDVWAAGALLFYLLCGREPFPLESSTQHRAWQNCMVHAPESLEWPAEFEHDKGPSSARDLVESMLQPLETRAILEQVLNHPWVTSTSPLTPIAAPATNPGPRLSLSRGRRSPFLCAPETGTPSPARQGMKTSGLESSKLEGFGNGRSRGQFSQVGGELSLHAFTDPQDAASQSTPTHANMRMCTPVIHRPEQEVLQPAAGGSEWDKEGPVKLQLPHVPLKDREVLQKDISDLIVVASEPSRTLSQRQ